MPTPTLDQLDRQLDAWQSSIDVVAQNLTDLRALPVYQRLSGSPGFEKARLTGETATKVDSALDLMCQMFEHLDRLYRVLNDAKLVRRELPSIFGGEDRMREIDRLLNTASIELPPVTTPVAARNLLSIPVTERKIQPRELLEFMIQSFEQAKAVVVDVDDTWRTLDMTVTRAELEIADLKQKVVPVPSELLSAEARIHQIRKEIDQDPLSARNAYAVAIEPLLERLRIEIREAERVRQEARQRLGAARALLEKLVDLNTQVGVSAADVREKIASPSVAVKDPVDVATVDALSKWLGTLEAKFGEGFVEPVLIGIDRWNTRAADSVRLAEAALAVNRVPIAERRELRGRLLALKAKAAAKGLAEDPELSQMASKASDLLYKTPTPLEETRDIVRQFERSLHGR